MGFDLKDLTGAVLPDGESGAAREAALLGVLCRQPSYREIRARLSEARQVLAPGGSLRIVEPNPWSPRARAWMRGLGISPFGFAQDRFPSGITPRQLRSLLARAGWASVSGPACCVLLRAVHVHVSVPDPGP